MRSLLMKCLVLVLSLALVSGNAHAALSLDGAAAPSVPCAEGHEHHHALAIDVSDAANNHDKRHHHAGDACCCECLGCTAAMVLTPPVALISLRFVRGIHIERAASSLAGRVLGPELDPPRPSALT